MCDISCLSCMTRTTPDHDCGVMCRGASISIVREEKMTDGRPPFLTYETMISKKAFAEFCQKQGCNGITSSLSMTHAASASDLAGMHAQHTTTTPQQNILPDQIILEDGDST